MMQLARKKKLCHIHTPFTVVWFGDAMRTDAQMHIADGLVMQCVKLHMVWFKCSSQTREIYAACEQSYTHIHAAPFRLWFHLMEHRSIGGGAFLSSVVKFRFLIKLSDASRPTILR